MRISLFYPMAFLLIGAMVWYALKPGLERRAEWVSMLAAASERGLVVEGERLEVLIATDQASVDFEGGENTRVAVVGSVGSVGEQENFGVHYLLPAEALGEFGAGEIALSLEIRAPRNGGADAWAVRCTLPSVGDSGWVRFGTSQAWNAYTLSCPSDGGASGTPLNVMIWSDIEGDAGRLELRRLRFERAPASVGSTG